MSGRFWIGLSFLFIGFGILLHQMNVIDLPHLLSIGWPLILIFIGIIQLIKRTSTSAVSGILFLFVGIFFLVDQWFGLNVIDYLWPILLIAVGLLIIFTRSRAKHAVHDENRIDSFVLLSGAEIRSQAPHFHGGSVTTVLGGADIDLRDAVFAEDAKLDVTCVLGGVSIKVPQHVQVELSGFPVMGGWEDQTRTNGTDEEIVVLHVNCLTILGGAEISN